MTGPARLTPLHLIGIAVMLGASMGCGPREARAPEDFAIRFEGWGRFDSDLGLATKGDTTIALRLTPAEKDSIYAKFVELEILKLPEPHPEITELRHIMPSVRERFEITANGRSKRFEWESGSVGPPYSPEWERFFEAIRYARETVTNRPEYKALPEPKAILR